jgi:hypothetical protein
MTEAGYALESPGLSALARPRTGRRLATSTAVWLFVAGNAAVMVWLWVHGGNVSDDLSTGELLTSVARITGLLGAYSALLQVLLLARLPPVERLFGFDRLTVWHRWNGHACLDLILAHVVLSVWGYALMDKISLPNEVTTMLGGGIYPGMITATVGTALLVAVVMTSVVIVRRRLRYEAWYAVHLLAYAGIALAWFHQIPTGNELVLDRVAADYWRALILGTLALLVAFRVIGPAVKALRYRLRVAEVVSEGPGIVSLRITGRRSTGSTRGPVSSSSGASSTGSAGGRRTPSRFRRRRTDAPSGSRSKPWAISRAGSRRSLRARRLSRRDRSASSRLRRAPVTRSP